MITGSNPTSNTPCRVYNSTENGGALLNEPTPAATTAKNINRIWNILPEKRE